MRRIISLFCLLCVASACAQTAVIRSDVREVLLNVSVRDDHQHIITDLNGEAFRVRVDNNDQRIASFRHEDLPVSLAIVIDNSGSMRTLRPEVNRAALDMIKDGNPADEVFVVNFTEEAYLDQDFTADVSLLEEALGKVVSHGATALYDALDAASEHLVKAGKYEKKAILVITDGEDTASQLNLQQALQHIAVNGGPATFAIGLTSPDMNRNAKKALKELAEKTGGEAFFPENIYQIDGIARAIAADLRNQYVLGVHLSITGEPGGYHLINVEAKSKKHSRMTARSRAGFYVPGANGTPSLVHPRQ